MLVLFLIFSVFSLYKHSKEERDEIINKLEEDIEKVEYAKLKILNRIISLKNEIKMLTSHLNAYIIMRKELQENIKTEALKLLYDSKTFSSKYLDLYNDAKKCIEECNYKITRLSNQMTIKEKDILECENTIVRCNETIEHLNDILAETLLLYVEL